MNNRDDKASAGSGIQDFQPSISDESVQAKTGKLWGEWFAILDAAGAEGWDHKGIVAFLAQNHQVSEWWQQSITVTYEQARGLRGKHQMTDGYQVSRSKTLPGPPAAAFQAWSDERLRRDWLGQAGLELRNTTPEKTVRFTWLEDNSRVQVSILPKPGDRSQVTVQHDRLAGPEQAEAMKTYWAGALERLKQWIEAGASAGESPEREA